MEEVLFGMVVSKAINNQEMLAVGVVELVYIPNKYPKP